MVLEPILCPTCGQDDIVKHGRSGEGKQRYKCRHQDCICQTFILDHEMWSYVQRKSQKRWLWHAIDHQTGEILAYMLAVRSENAIPKRLSGSI